MNLKKLKPLIFVSLIAFQFAFLEKCEIPGIKPKPKPSPYNLSLLTDKSSYVLSEDVWITATIRNQKLVTTTFSLKIELKLPDGARETIYDAEFDLLPEGSKEVKKERSLSLESQVGNYTVIAKVKDLDKDKEINKTTTFFVGPPVEIESVRSDGLLVPGGKVKFNITLRNKASRTVDKRFLWIKGSFETGNFYPSDQEKVIFIGAEMSKVFNLEHQIEKKNSFKPYTYLVEVSRKDELWDRTGHLISLNPVLELDKLEIENVTLGEIERVTFYLKSLSNRTYPSSRLTVRFRIGESLKGEETVDLGTIEAGEEFKKSVTWDTSVSVEGRHHIDAWAENPDYLLYNETDIGSFVVRS